MKKTHLLLSALAMIGMLASCRSTAESSTKKDDAKTSDTSATTGNSTKKEDSTKKEPEVVETIFEHQFVFNSPGATMNEDGTSTDNTLVHEAWGNGIVYNAKIANDDEKASAYGAKGGTSKNGGPNYQVWINLLKEDHKVEAGRSTMYYGGSLVGKDAFTTTGTWSKGADGTYIVNLEAFEYNVQGTGKAANDATTLTSDANGNIIWDYKGVKKNKKDDGTTELVDNPYHTTLNTQKSFAGEYTGSYWSITDFLGGAPEDAKSIDSCEVTALADGTYTVKGAVEDSGISAFTGTIDTKGIFKAENGRLGGEMSGMFYTDTDGKVKFDCISSAREREAHVWGELI